MKQITTLLILLASFQSFAKTATEEMLGSQIRFSMSPALTMKYDVEAARANGVRIYKEDGVKYSIPYFKPLRLNNQVCMMSHRSKLNLDDKDYAKKAPVFQKRIHDQSDLTLDSSRTWTVIPRSKKTEDDGQYVRLESFRDDGTSDRITLRCYLAKDSQLDGQPLTAAQIFDLFKSKGAVFTKGGKPLQVERQVAKVSVRKGTPALATSAACNQ